MIFTKSLSKKSIVAISGPDRGGGPAWFFTALQVRLTGGAPVRVHPSSNYEKIQFDALILGGGADISQDLYRQNNDKDENKITAKNWRFSFFKSLGSLLLLIVRRVFSYESSRGKSDPQRDKMEWSLLDHAIKENKPVLGICRGMQFINIYFGGTLNPDLRSFYEEYPQVRSVFPKKSVVVFANTKLHTLTRSTEMKINALHDQAIGTLGQGLQISAQEENGIVQAIETQDPKKCVIGVQWHPEFILQDKEQRRLFAWLSKSGRTFK